MAAILFQPQWVNVWIHSIKLVKIKTDSKKFILLIAC